MGIYEETEDGFNWSIVFASEGAQGLRLHLQDVSLPEGVEAFFMNNDGGVDGPYIGDHEELYTRTLSGEEATLLVTYSGDSRDEARVNTSIGVTQVGIFNPYPSADDASETRQLE